MGINWRKGFYFSFDALLALTLMSATLVLVSQSSEIASDSFKVSSIDYRTSTTTGQDAMKLASQQSFNSFNDSFTQELEDQTIMEKSDLNRTIIDGVSLLWAARNISHAEQVTRKYFDSKIPEDYEYRLQVNEGGSRTVIYESSTMPDDPQIVSSISRLVSGHKIDRPSEGFQARARATSITKNQTEIFSLPAMGNANENGKLEIRKNFTVPDNEEIHYAYFYLNEEYNGDTMFEQMMVNGQQKKNDYTVIHQFDNDVVYARWDIADALQDGQNNIYIRVKGDASQSEPTEFQPGSKIEIKYSRGREDLEEDRLRHEKIYFEDMKAENPGSSEAGIFKVESFDLPQNADFVNASIHLKANNLDSGNCGYNGGWFGPYYPWDVTTIFNGETLDQTCASGTFEREYLLSEDQVQNGTNIFTVYLENYGNTFWGGESVELYSNTADPESSHIDLWYNVSEESLRFGEIKVTAAEEMGGIAENPKEDVREFQQEDLASTQVYIVERYSNEVELDVSDGTGYETVFRSPGVRATPTRINIPTELYDVDGENYVRLYDYYKSKVGEYGSPDDIPENGDEDLVKFWPESTFQWTVWVPSQVGYGTLFENQTAAVTDAEQRLRDTMGDYVDATSIDTGTVSTGNQPYLWGPASVRLVIWRE